MTVFWLLVLPCILSGVLGFRGDDIKTHFESYYDEWLVFKKTHNKVYVDMKTEMVRYDMFKANLKYMEKHNRQFQLGKTSFYLGINAFADLSHEEFMQDMHLDSLMRHRSGGATHFLPSSDIQLPDTVDWRDKGYVTPVKNQGQCGSCWSFSTTGSLEGQHFKRSGQLVSLSEQQLVDCAVSFGERGCNGGFMDYAFDYIKEKGIESESSYPYKAKEYKCKYNSSLVVAKCTGHVDVPKKESALKNAVGTVGPVSIAIDASHRSFQLYRGGVYDEPSCSSTRLDHGVLAVGYGTDQSGTDYWLVKNSWGSSWGEQGYIKMSRNKNNQCGVANEASYPLV